MIPTRDNHIMKDHGVYVYKFLRKKLLSWENNEYKLINSLFLEYI